MRRHAISEMRDLDQTRNCSTFSATRYKDRQGGLYPHHQGRLPLTATTSPMALIEFVDTATSMPRPRFRPGGMRRPAQRA